MNRNIAVKIVLLIALLALPLISCAIEPEGDEDAGKKITHLINDLREEQGLDPISVSESLAIVATKHAKDLQENGVISEDCNAHSWSDDGNWEPCCFTNDGSALECMTDKPEEITGYPDSGYELVARLNGAYISPQEAMEVWQSSEASLDIILSRGSWAGKKWKAMGAARNKEFAVLWFGETYEPAD